MKTLYIIRHAKSSWNFDFPDELRPLGIRGRRDVVKMGKALSKNLETPDLMISSTASRALYTALHIADEWGYPEEQIKTDNRLYHAEPSQIFKILTEQPNVNSIAIFGHNPGLTDLINILGNEYLDNLPTCGVYMLSLKIQNWSELKNTNGEKKVLITPKGLKTNGHIF